ncbi:hypothetical protein DPMN_134727 [Dreissena polymorpha]|uniref:Uncharacterized protein n=1 Tax=Dreissena polymorpha TaxID=45954 RepID=A0A9D4JAY5_DREPO|nr:hypothetical protein DPMN_134727 [Dreissena polymorpha]
MCLFICIYFVFSFINKIRREYNFRKTPRISESPNARTKELSWEKANSPENQQEINKVREELAREKANISKYQLEIRKVKDELSREKANNSTNRLEIYKVKEKLSSEKVNSNSKKLKLENEELLEWRVKCEERETRRAKKYNAILGGKESAEEGQAQLQRQLKETNVQMQKMRERLLQCNCKDASETATLQTITLQFQTEIFKMKKNNTRLHDHIKALTSNVDITSEENKNLRQQLETVRNQAKISLVEKERQLCDVLFRIEEEHSNHIEEVTKSQIEHQN